MINIIQKASESRDIRLFFTMNII